MRPVLTPAQAAELDLAAQERGVTGAALMESAGRAVARACVDVMGGGYGRRVVVVCGKGNNGGDGLVAARHLARWGVAVAVVLVDGEDLREPSATNLRRVRSETFARVGGPSRLHRELERADCVVDAIFGTGFRGVPEDDPAAAIASINAATVPVVAVDVPSGVDGTSGSVAGEAIRAELTVTFGAAKTGIVLLPGAARAGTVRVVEIGFPPDLIRTDVFLTEPGDVARLLPRRPVDTHKRVSGVLLVVAGSRGMTGAPQLIAHAAGRVGAGLVQVAVPESALAAVQSGLVEATFVALPETANGSVSMAALDPVLEALGRADALALGPGMTTDEQTARSVRELVAVCPVPVVLDADGLNAFTGDASALADRRSEAVLTPHAGEFGRLTGVKGPDLDADRIGHVRALASTTAAVTLLKGARTVIAAAGGSEARINVTGSPVLATAGTGDVLTGMIGGLLAQGMSPMEAAASGAYLHGLAGMLAGIEKGESIVAGDVVESIPAAIATVREGS